MDCILAVDVGTTHCKAALYAADGACLRVSKAHTPTRSRAGHAYYDPDELWSAVAAVVRDVCAAAPAAIRSIGIASMAETGLLVDRATGLPRTHFIPWFDTRAQAHAQQIQDRAGRLGLFARTGIHASFKCGLAKVLWLRAQDARLPDGAVWLSVADYVAFRLTGVLATDHSLAGRTGAFRIDARAWDEDWLQDLGLPTTLFPDALPGMSPLGDVRAEVAADLGLSGDTQLVLAGHDHVCAAFAAGATQPDIVFDSMGTAETLVGMHDGGPLGDAEFESGLLYGCHVTPAHRYWMGSISSSGGSVEWLRSLLGLEAASYEEMDRLLASASDGPTGILYFPYLLGSGSPQADPDARAAFAGLSATDSRGDILKAMLEGTAFQVRAIRAAAEELAGGPIEFVIAAGGGTRNAAWLQVKADVLNCPISVLPQPEATLLGAALCAGIGAGLYADEQEARQALCETAVQVYKPHAAHARAYRDLYERGFCRLQAPLLAYHRQMGSEA